MQSDGIDNPVPMLHWSKQSCPHVALVKTQGHYSMLMLAACSKVLDLSVGASWGAFTAGASLAIGPPFFGKIAVEVSPFADD